MKKVRMHVDIRQQAIIDPLDFMNTLKDLEIGSGHWVFKKDGKYYVGWMTNRSYEESEEITRSKFDYIQAINLVISVLKNNKTQSNDTI